ESWRKCDQRQRKQTRTVTQPRASQRRDDNRQVEHTAQDGRSNSGLDQYERNRDQDYQADKRDAVSEDRVWNPIPDLLESSGERMEWSGNESDCTRLFRL